MSKLALIRLVFRLIAMFRVYSIWSRAHRLLFDRAAKGTMLPTFNNIDEVLPFVRGMVWRADSWIDMWDAICSPEMVWYRYLNVADHKVGDCDEYACFWSNVIQKSIEDDVWKSNIEDPDILSVTWINKEGRLSGHNVCLLRMGTIYGYIDYDIPRWCGKKEQVVQGVMSGYADPGSDLIGWMVHSPKLKLREYHTR